MIRFGVAGYPIAFNESEYRRDRSKIFEWVSSLGLEAVELQMTYGPRTKPEKCSEYRHLAEEFGVRISVHAAYYIVLTSDEPEKINRSIDTLKRTFELSDLLGAKEVILHPGPLYGHSSDEVSARFLENAERFSVELGKTDIGLFIETAGKVGQLGSAPEILELSSQLDGVHPCVDFGHVHARTLGTLEDPAAIFKLVEKLKDFRRQHPSKRLHFHYPPIHFGKRGEIQHRAVDDRYPELEQADLFSEARIGETSSDGMYHPRPEPVTEALSILGGDFTVISETHNSQEIGALCLKDNYLRVAQQKDEIPEVV